jgi:hypothetical protein
MSLAKDITKLASTQSVTSLVHSYGLAVNTVSWEDTGRSKGSCWGPNISDMTLYVDPYNMPVVRKPNFADVTADRNIGDFSVAVGNESGEPLKQIPFREYLENLDKYTKNENVKPMLLERDSNLLVSSQACILPLSDGEVEFCVRLYNYQSGYDSSDPAVLVIVASAQGTSAQVVYGTTNLYLNNDGRSFNLKAARLSDDRLKRGVPLDGPMTDDEKNRNALFIYQVPLKQKFRPERCTLNDLLCGTMEGCAEPMAGCAVPMSYSAGCPPMTDSRSARGFEKAVLSKGRDMGRFTGTKDLTLERDERFPIRCTVQYYNVTDVATLSEDQVKDLAQLIGKVYESAPATGSLVLSTTDRVTETTVKPVVQNFLPEGSSTLGSFM